MTITDMNNIQVIQSKIYVIRGQRVMLDFDLAELYCVETRVLNQAVKRNIERFPDDFMFRLMAAEWEVISSQFVMTSRIKRPKSALPLAFTEHGVLMLSSILHSDVAIEVSIKITRAFVALRRMASSLPQTAADVAQLRKDFEDLKLDIEDILHNQNEINEDTRTQLDAISAALAELQSKEPREKPRRKIGFVQEEEEDIYGKSAPQVSVGHIGGGNFTTINSHLLLRFTMMLCLLLAGAAFFVSCSEAEPEEPQLSPKRAVESDSLPPGYVSIGDVVIDTNWEDTIFVEY